MVLRRETGVFQIAVYLSPLVESPIIKHFQFVRDDERHMPVGQAFLEKDQSAYTPVPVLERMDALKANMEVENVIQRLWAIGMILGKKCFHLLVYLFRWTGIESSHFIRKTFVISYGKPFFPLVGGSCFQYFVEAFDKSLREACIRSFDDQVDASEMVHRFQDVVYVHRFMWGRANRIGFKDVTGLVSRQFTSLHMIGVVCQVDLRPMVDASFQPHFHFFPKPLEQRRAFLALGMYLYQVQCFVDSEHF